MGSAVELYEKLRSAPDDQTRARLIAEAFEQMEERYPEITDLATASHVRESELRLQKEIEQLRSEMHAMDGRLTKEIEQLRSDTHAMDGRLTKEIEQLRSEMHAMDGRLTKEIEQLRSDTHAMDGRLTKEIEQLRADSRTEIAHAKVDIIKWTAGMLAVQLALIGAIAKWLAG
ncbi:MAG: coiled-coil domain-containing protein [Halorhodospira sp.]